MISALSIVFVTSVMAGETNSTNSQSTSHPDLSKGGLVVAVTEHGEIAANTAWLLSRQMQSGQHKTPILLVLKPETRQETLQSLNLVDSELPALIFLDSNGKELNRVVDAAPSAKGF